MHCDAGADLLLFELLFPVFFCFILNIIDNDVHFILFVVYCFFRQHLLSALRLLLFSASSPPLSRSLSRSSARSSASLRNRERKS